MSTTNPLRLPAASVAVLLLGALASWPYDYFVVLRWVVTAGALLVAVVGYRLTQPHTQSNQRWVRIALPVFGALAVLFNPLAPFEMWVGHWHVVDLFGAVTFGAVAFIDFALDREPRSDRRWSLSPSEVCTTAAVLAAVVVLSIVTTSASGGVPHGNPDCPALPTEQGC